MMRMTWWNSRWRVPLVLPSGRLMPLTTNPLVPLTFNHFIFLCSYLSVNGSRVDGVGDFQKVLDLSKIKFSSLLSQPPLMWRGTFLTCAQTPKIVIWQSLKWAPIWSDVVVINVMLSYFTSKNFCIFFTPYRIRIPLIWTQCVGFMKLVDRDWLRRRRMRKTRWVDLSIHHFHWL